MHGFCDDIYVVFLMEGFDDFEEESWKVNEMYGFNFEVYISKVNDN